MLISYLGGKQKSRIHFLNGQGNIVPGGTGMPLRLACLEHRCSKSPQITQFLSQLYLSESPSGIMASTIPIVHVPYFAV